MSELQVYVEGAKIIVCIAGTRIDFSPTVAEMLSEMLQVHIPIAQAEIDAIRAHHKALLELDSAITDSWQQLLPEQQEAIDSLVAQGHLDVAVQTLSLLLGEAFQYDCLTKYWCIDDQARYSILVPWKEQAASLITAISKAPKESRIGRLWEAGSFDDSLFLYCTQGTINSESSLGQRIVLLSHMMQHISATSFSMGDDSTLAWDFEQPVHSVQLSKGFWIGRYTVTQQLYDAVTGENPAAQKGPFLPVTNVSWLDAVVFCNQLSERDGLEICYQIQEDAIEWNRAANGYRLPTEAEWECAARSANTQVEGDRGVGHQFAGSHDPDEVAWTSENSDSILHAVGAKKSNAMGLYDMSGNIWEWCWDYYDSQYYSSSPLRDPEGPSSGSLRVCRGGSFSAVASNARVSLRGRFLPETTWVGLGFRVVRNTQEV